MRSRAEAIRKAVRDVLVDQVPEGETVSGRVGSIESHRRESTRPKDESEIFDALDEHEIPRGWVLSQQFDSAMLEKLVEDTDTELAASDVYETSVSRYVTREDFDLDP